jgi:NAD(P)-dependent dehydrogenase (short-subunit alcohol dehydrogenase family)
MTSFLETRTNLSGKVAAIIGGANAIGAPVTLALARAGVDVAVCDRSPDDLDRLRIAVEALGRRILTISAEPTDPADLDCFYDAVGERFERLDIVVNAIAGVTRGLFMDAPREKIAHEIQANYGYFIQSVQRAVPLIQRGQRGGSIINFTSIEAHRGAATFSVYAGARAATTNFTRSVAVELGAQRIRLNCLAPDSIPSELSLWALSEDHRLAMQKTTDEQRQLKVEMYIPMKQQPPLDAIADSVLFLASDMSAFITGTTIHIDGGTMAASGFIDWPEGDGQVPSPLAGTLNRLMPSA